MPALPPALFITYDGLLDTLGGSQILPYIRGIAAHPRSIHVLSFEKSDRYASGGEELRRTLAAEGIGWTALPFTRRLGKVGKAWDLVRMYAAGIALQSRHHFRVIHCRSYQAMQTGVLLSRLFGPRTIFDMRGLWVDERIDGRIWRTDRAIDRMSYRMYKRTERKLLRRADHIVSLTQRVIPELQRIAPNLRAPVTVIPCCADFDHFQPPLPERRDAVRAGLGIPQGARLFSYLGSLGTWYMFDDMLRFFARATGPDGDEHFLLITRDWGEVWEHRIEALGLGWLRSRVLVRPATRDEVPELLGASDLMLSFIKPAYSKLASSPTKLAEAYAVGVPVISNGGVGDVDAQTARLDAGAVLELDDETAILHTIARLDAIIAKGGTALRVRAKAELDLGVAQRLYRGVYRTLDNRG